MRTLEGRVVVDASGINIDEDVPLETKVQFKNVRLKRLPLEDVKKIVFVAGKPSHAPRQHEHNAGCLLLAKLINENVPAAHATVYQDGWPKDPTALDNADSIVIFCDGGPRHLAMGHLEEMDRLMKKGVGLACLHYGVEIPKGEPGNYLLDWIGGYFESDWSVNPHWTPNFKEFPDHELKPSVARVLVEVIFLQEEYAEAHRVSVEVREDMQLELRQLQKQLCLCQLVRRRFHVVDVGADGVGHAP